MTVTFERQGFPFSAVRAEAERDLAVNGHATVGPASRRHDTGYYVVGCEQPTYGFGGVERKAP